MPLQIRCLVLWARPPPATEPAGRLRGRRTRAPRRSRTPCWFRGRWPRPQRRTASTGPASPTAPRKGRLGRRPPRASGCPRPPPAWPRAGWFRPARGERGRGFDDEVGACSFARCPCARWFAVRRGDAGWGWGGFVYIQASERARWWHQGESRGEHHLHTAWTCTSGRSHHHGCGSEPAAQSWSSRRWGGRRLWG